MRAQNHNPNDSHVKIAIEDAIVLGLITLISGLLTKGYPPSYETLYMVGLNALLTGLYSWARARGIKHESE